MQCYTCGHDYTPPKPRSDPDWSGWANIDHAPSTPDKCPDCVLMIAQLAANDKRRKERRP
jgi:hypothetical protein